MSPCVECNQLTLKPLRPDVPANFERTLASDISSGLTRFIYQCAQCGDFWCWRAPQGWQRELTQPPHSEQHGEPAVVAAPPRLETASCG